jgi:hypothetical protein
MYAKSKAGASEGFLPLILLVALIVVYLASLFALIQTMNLRDAVFGKWEPLLSPRQHTAINIARRIRQYWPYWLLPLSLPVAVHFLIKKSWVKVIVNVVFMAAVIILTIILLSLVSRLPAPALLPIPAFGPSVWMVRGGWVARGLGAGNLRRYS